MARNMNDLVTIHEGWMNAPDTIRKAKNLQIGRIRLRVILHLALIDQFQFTRVFQVTPS
jgi:hypothetical protein